LLFFNSIGESGFFISPPICRLPVNVVVTDRAGPDANSGAIQLHRELKLNCGELMQG